MKRTLLAVGLALVSMAAFANTDAKNDTLAETVTSLCRDAGVAKS